MNKKPSPIKMRTKLLTLCTEKNLSISTQRIIFLSFNNLEESEREQKAEQIMNLIQKSKTEIVILDGLENLAET